MKFFLIPKSFNRKTGPIPVTTSSKGTCPNTCPYKKNNACYAATGPLAIHWNNITKGSKGSSYQHFLEQIKNIPNRTLWRHNQAGDLIPLRKGSNEIHKKALESLTRANRYKKGFTYTHYPVEGKTQVARHNKMLIKNACKGGFIINLSANNPQHADNLLKLNIAPVTTTLPSDIKQSVMYSPAGHPILVCPVARHHPKLDSCAKCQLCAKYPRKFIIGFPAHGIRKKLINRLINEL